MKVSYTIADLIAFEDEIAELFAEKRIHAPVHLAGGNEEQLIRIFEEHVNPDDWVLCSWRSHYHCLLKGVPPEQLRRAILDGKSISLCFPEYRILSSGIVGGTAPIAVGLAMGIWRKSEHLSFQDCSSMTKMAKVGRKVVCFLGDMTAETGIVHESIKYAVNFNLPVLFVIEDNELSGATCTPSVWGREAELRSIGLRYPAVCEGFGPYQEGQKCKVLRYKYRLTRPHVGIGKHVVF